jgi:thiol-disulfide isomerase/thioredoxin
MLFLDMQQKLNRLAFIFAALYLSIQVRAATVDTIKLTGKVIITSGALPATDVKLNPYAEGADAQNTYLNSDGSFEFRVPVKDVELYEVRYGGYAKSILFTKEEHDLGFEIYVKDGKPDQMFITNSRENQAHEIFRAGNIELRDTLKGFRGNCVPNAADCVKHWAQILIGHNASLQQLMEQFPETFTAKVLAPMAKTPVVNSQQSPIETMERHFFDPANFTDGRLFITPDLGVKLITYLDNIADTSRNARLNFISEMFLKSMGSVDARKKIATALYNIFTKTNRENYLQSMCEWAAAQPWADEQLPVVSARLKLTSKVLPGCKAPNEAGTDLQGVAKSLTDEFKNHKLTMLLFWESDCPHCRQSMPEFVRLYEKYKSEGFTVVAASLDHDPVLWKKFIDDNHLTWININLPQTTTSYSDYFIQATPTTVLIDKKGIIIHRFMEVKELDEMIAKALK